MAFWWMSSTVNKKTQWLNLGNMLTRHCVFENCNEVYISDLQVQRIKIKVTLPFLNTSALKRAFPWLLAGERV